MDIDYHSPERRSPRGVQRVAGPVALIAAAAGFVLLSLAAFGDDHLDGLVRERCAWASLCASLIGLAGGIAALRSHLGKLSLAISTLTLIWLIVIAGH